MSIIVVVALSSAADERRASLATRESTLALYAAEAGLRQTYGAWPSTSVKALNPGDSLDLGWQSLPNNAMYRAVIHRLDKGGLQQYNVVVQGRRAASNGGISTIMGAVSGVPVYTYGIYSKTDINIGANGFYDGYDSEEAPYNPLAPDSTAVLWANGNVSLAKSTVLGDVTAVGTISYAQNPVVTGTATTSAPPAPAMDINPCPVGAYTPAANVPSGAGISYNANTGVLSANQAAVVTLAASTYYFNSLTLTGNAQVVVSPAAGQQVQIIVSDQVSIAGGFATNLSSDPARLEFSSCGSPANPSNWAISGGSQSFYSVYAPNHPVTVSGNADIWGAVVAASYSSNGGAKLHYDAALARKASTKLSAVGSTWSFLPGN